jgi:hypothetical protein
MLDLSFFKKLASYSNNHWKCKMTEHELNNSSMEMFQEFTRSKRRGKLSEDMTVLVQNLKEDSENGGTEAKELLGIILKEFEVV